MRNSVHMCIWFSQLFWLRQICWEVEKNVSMSPKKSTKKSASLEQGAKGKTLEKTKEQTNL